MIIRTNMADRAAASERVAAPRLSEREKRRLENSKYPEGKVSPVIPEKIVEEVKPEPVQKEVRVEKTIEEEKELVAVDEAIAQPGTIMIRSKALEEIENKKTEQNE